MGAEKAELLGSIDHGCEVVVAQEQETIVLGRALLDSFERLPCVESDTLSFLPINIELLHYGKMLHTFLLKRHKGHLLSSFDQGRPQNNPFSSLPD